jgi:hypothetical protein
MVQNAVVVQRHTFMFSLRQTKGEVPDLEMVQECGSCGCEFVFLAICRFLYCANEHCSYHLIFFVTFAHLK